MCVKTGISTTRTCTAGHKIKSYLKQETSKTSTRTETSVGAGERLAAALYQHTLIVVG